VTTYFFSPFLPLPSVGMEEGQALSFVLRPFVVCFYYTQQKEGVLPFLFETPFKKGCFKKNPNGEGAKEPLPSYGEKRKQDKSTVRADH